jgi:hypothetical protein
MVRKVFHLVIYILIALVIPIVLLNVLASSPNHGWFTISLLSYCLIYRPVIDYFRLVGKKLIRKSDFWKMFNPGFAWRLTVPLYLP